jgi:hypothetical protein
MPLIDPTIAHIAAPDGTVFQTLNADGTDWDEPATRADYDAAQAAIVAQQSDFAPGEA